jgi:hypothetical protein
VPHSAQKDARSRTDSAMGSGACRRANSIRRHSPEPVAAARYAAL